ncbi:MAG: transketolase [Bacteroidetes bacterium]|nr:transketolase [Bacteroidota bacterium]
MSPENLSASLTEKKELSFEELKSIILSDYKIAVESREASLLGRKEVLTGKAKFGIFGDGKEVPQIAMARQFKNGDFRSGYYRDQTFMMAIGQLTVQQFFAQLYAHTDVEAEPASAGRQMNGHYATRSLNEDGTWKNLAEMKNSSADISPTAGQMPRLLGLAQASKVYRENPALHSFTTFSDKGNEVAFGTIGDASTSEGLFWETFNAAGVLQVPMAISVWDDGHGISVPKKYQTTKESISDILKGFQREEGTNGYEIFKVNAWDYPSLIETYENAVSLAREEHVPVLIHVEEVTQPQGHSTSGSHERYKSKERLQWEIEFDCIRKMKEWVLESALATEEELEQIETEAKTHVKDSKNAAWKAYLEPIKAELNEVTGLLEELAQNSSNKAFIDKIKSELAATIDPVRKDIFSASRKALRLVINEKSAARQNLQKWLKQATSDCHSRYSSHLYSESKHAAINVVPGKASYDGSGQMVDGREILRDNFDAILEKYPEVLIFGEDAGKIGGVNQGLEGLQAKYGESRVFDTGIREATIIGQGIGMAMRGLRPIAEIQYLDYLLYALQIMSDDLATVQYRTKGGQKAPLIIRTRGHRLEGIWHSGSPMGMIIHALRGIYVCVPRNMVQAAGFYNTLLQGDDPALVIEPLNGYRLKEERPENLGEFKVKLGIPETLVEGNSLTLVTYGSSCRIATEAAKQLLALDINIEVIDVQTLLPFDVNEMIVESVKKTNRLVILDEDVEGGASGFILQQILENQKAYQYLDSAPKTITAKNHRPAYGSDGDYFSKPSIEDVVEQVYEIMNEANPEKYQAIF